MAISAEHIQHILFTVLAGGEEEGEEGAASDVRGVNLPGSEGHTEGCGGWSSGS